MKNKKNEEGMVLLAVVVAVSVALMVGVSVSTRSLSMSNRVSRTDTSSRLIATAEGGMERLLRANECLLKELSEGTYANCDTIGLTYEEYEGVDYCSVSYPPSQDEGDNVNTAARLRVEPYRYTYEEDGSVPYYSFLLTGGQMKEVVLYNVLTLEEFDGNSLMVCFYDTTDTAFYYVIYNNEDKIIKGGYHHASMPNVGEKLENFDSASVNGTYDDGACGEIDNATLTKLRENGAKAFGLRIKSLYNNVYDGTEGDAIEYRVYPIAGDLPQQGYKLVSIGELTRGAEEKTTRVLVGYRSYSYIPDVFDYNIYSTQPIVVD